MVPLAAICFTFVVTLLLVVLCQQHTGRIGSSLRLQQDDSSLDKRKPTCPGPVLEPNEREEPWNKNFSEKLNKEVTSKDADKVQHPFWPPKYLAAWTHVTQFLFQGCELVFYGDSITETWRATDKGRECPQSRCEGMPEVFKHYFGKFSTSVLAVGGEAPPSLHASR